MIKKAIMNSNNSSKEYRCFKCKQVLENGDLVLYDTDRYETLWHRMAIDCKTAAKYRIQRARRKRAF